MNHEAGTLKLKVDTSGEGPIFWFQGTFVSTQKRSPDPNLSWSQKEEAAFKSLVNFGLTRGDYRYVELVDGQYSNFTKFEGTSAAFARKDLSVPDKYKFLDLNGVLSLHTLDFFATDYKRVVTNLVDAMKRDKPLTTEEIKHLLLKKGRSLLYYPKVPRLDGKRARSPPSKGDTRDGAEEESARKRAKRVAEPTYPPVGGIASVGGREAPAEEKGAQIETQDGDCFLESDFEIEPEILSSLEGLFEARKGEHQSYCINPSAETRREKARTAIEAMGMDPSFPIYKQLAERLGKYEGTTTAYATQDLRLNEQTGVNKVPDLNCALTIFALTEMASDLHRLVVGIRRLIKSGKDAGNKQLSQLLYQYEIHGDSTEDLIFADNNGVPICDESEAMEYVEYYKARLASRLAWKAQSSAELD